MKDAVWELISIIEDLEKKLKEKEEDLNAVLEYLHYKGIYITVHTKQLSSDLDNKVIIDKEEVSFGSDKE